MLVSSSATQNRVVTEVNKNGCFASGVANSGCYGPWPCGMCDVPVDIAADSATNLSIISYITSVERKGGYSATACISTEYRGF